VSPSQHDIEHRCDPTACCAWLGDRRSRPEHCRGKFYKALYRCAHLNCHLYRLLIRRRTINLHDTFFDLPSLSTNTMLVSATLAIAALVHAASGAALPSDCTSLTLSPKITSSLVLPRFRYPLCRARRILRLNRKPIQQLHRPGSLPLEPVSRVSTFQNPKIHMFHQFHRTRLQRPHRRRFHLHQRAALHIPRPDSRRRHLQSGAESRAAIA
jgi:hypothetical protein